MNKTGTCYYLPLTKLHNISTSIWLAFACLNIKLLRLIRNILKMKEIINPLVATIKGKSNYRYEMKYLNNLTDSEGSRFQKKQDV